MIYLAILWIVVSIVALGPALVAAWRLRRWKRTMRFVIAALVGTAIDNVILAGLALASIPTLVDRSLDLNIGVVLMTIGYLIRTLSVAALALSLILVFHDDGPPAPERDVL
jgi:hypothetical protein